jgi:translation initiation factor eIF-2B subunit delta
MAIDLDLKLRPVIQFLIDCRPLAIGMGNAIKYLKRQIGATTTMEDNEAKQFLISEIDRYIQERIVYAVEAMCATTADQIQDGDLILTYASSHVVEASFKRAKAAGKNFQVIVVDSRPRFEGKTLLERLTAAGIQCSYVLLNAVSYIMKGVDKVIMGAHSMLSNGQVYSRCGTAVVSMVAAAQNIPVLICCETYKFADRVQVDAISQNELDDPDSLCANNGDGEDKLAGWKSNDSLKLLNLVYDLTPMEFVSMVISEVGLIPPTSVPVVIREYQLRTQEQIQQDRAFY